MKDNNVEATGPNSGESPKPKFQNRAERNKDYKSQAQILFEGKQILNERLGGMSKEEYQILRKLQSETIKRLFHRGKSPSRKLQGILGSKEPLARTTKGLKRIVRQRKAS